MLPPRSRTCYDATALSGIEFRVWCNDLFYKEKDIMTARLKDTRFTLITDINIKTHVSGTERLHFFLNFNDVKSNWSDNRSEIFFCNYAAVNLNILFSSHACAFHRAPLGIDPWLFALCCYLKVGCDNTCWLLILKIFSLQNNPINTKDCNRKITWQLPTMLMLSDYSKETDYAFRFPSSLDINRFLSK